MPVAGAFIVFQLICSYSGNFCAFSSLRTPLVWVKLFLKKKKKKCVFDRQVSHCFVLTVYDSRSFYFSSFWALLFCFLSLQVERLFGVFQWFSLLRAYKLPSKYLWARPLSFLHVLAFLGRHNQQFIRDANLTHSVSLHSNLRIFFPLNKEISLIFMNTVQVISISG